MLTQPVRTNQELVIADRWHVLYAYVIDWALCPK